MKLAQLKGVLATSLRNHGGGWRGAWSVVRRTLDVVRSVGWRGFLNRIQGAQRRMTARPASIPTHLNLPAPADIDAIHLRVGVMVHAYYPDLLDELRGYLEHVPLRFHLMLSVVDEATRQVAVAQLSGMEHVDRLSVRIVPNRGRDLAPFYVAFAEEIAALDVVAHAHTKKSLYTGRAQDGWRQYLLETLFGTREKVAWILGLFQAMPELGMVYPESYRDVPLEAHAWRNNLLPAREIADRLGLDLDPLAYLDFPAGSMFWARVDGLRPLLDLRLAVSDFPEERGQIDGTLHHALERLVVPVVRQQGLISGVMPADGSRLLYAEGERNWKAYFDSPVGERIRVAAMDADALSLDIFDTLVTRVFLHPEGARALFAERIERRYGLEDFARARTEAETAARVRLGTDVNLAAIYRQLAAMHGRAAPIVDTLRREEEEWEHLIVRSRQAVVAAADAIAARGKAVLAVSDTYLDNAALRRILPRDVLAPLSEIVASCDHNARKDTGELWKQLIAREGTTPPERWQHVGDNEASDLQRPADLGFRPPVHVLRPSALLEVVPALRPLRPTAPGEPHWASSLMTGLLAQRLASMADATPGDFDDVITFNDPRTLGYVVGGPLVVDYVAWLHRLARQRDCGRILFLSREGYVLEHAYRLMSEASRGNAPRGVYMYASRRGCGVPSLRRYEDLQRLLRGDYTGPLSGLLRARLGEAICEGARVLLGDDELQRTVFLPDQREALMLRLRPLESPLLFQAQEEREAYEDYLRDCLGDSKRAMIADIGYAGTIQSHLLRLGAPVEGAYMALRGRSPDLDALDATTFVRHGMDTATTHDAVLAQDLLLERLLSATDGQFQRMVGTGAQRRILLGPGTTAPERQTVGELHAGVLEFVREVCHVAGEDVFRMDIGAAAAGLPLSCLASRRWRPGDWAEGLRLEDDFSGRGNVKLHAGGRD